jgi:predicted O-methyltransferase YrrM
VLPRWRTRPFTSSRSRATPSAQGPRRSGWRRSRTSSCWSGPWEEHLPPRAPFDLVIHDAGNFKRAPEELGELVVDLLAPGGLLILDDLTPGDRGQDAIRDWARRHPRLAAEEILTTPATAALVLARR